ncbi:PREDICTED: RING-H2 finger protein ATL7-like [Erythranthe guttata]|uniref:RING-H2 finger protein ATL7-like n=1 Tax=Erythranthe guttata TaxID=4155 RepID=UPI00064DC581|nr:PREDICTED: RING-H2 finger protein ATL7-like [Erythranthe guttata]|eukprot:XP_012828831.1 PREDICTED: RING-H2 finger protein ATL7-like [Erythranthe guttata]
MSSNQFSSFEESQKYMEEKLTTTSSGLSRLKSSNRRELVDYPLREAGKYIAGGRAYRVLNLHFDVLLEHEYIYLRDINNYDESTLRMVPAENSSIDRVLKTVEYSRNIPEMDCSVCLESFWGDDYNREELLSMPCAHIFHGDCIKKWLRTSHYCPLCRFEMPTS